MPEALNAVIYARYSSDRQTEQSIEGQLRECYAFAKANDIAVIDTYIDRAISGKTDNRPAFQKMIEDSAKRQFQAVIVYRLDRFTRNRYDSAIYKARLKKNGVKVLSAMENLNGSPESIIMESLLEGMAEYYSVELSQKITRGMRENALKGKALGGQRVLGYKVNSDCYFEIDETTAPVVVDIFKLYSSGKTVKEICDILNARGVKTARGGAFNKNSLHTILTNKKYIGIYKTKYGEIVGGIPAIIDKELFEMVALRMEQNKKAPARAKAEINYLLSTKLFCGKCRSAMVGESGTSKTGKKYYYYACVKKKREKACDKSNVKKDWIEDLVIQRTVTDILKDDVIEKIADRLVELQKAEAAESGTMLYLENSLAEIQVSIKNIMTAIEKGIITESTKTRLTELEDEKRNVEIEIAKESIARRIISREQIIYWISSFKDGDITSEKYCQQLIDTFVHAVFVYDDKIVITYNYSGENNTATISDLDLSSPPNQKSEPLSEGTEVRIFLFSERFGILKGEAAVIFDYERRIQALEARVQALEDALKKERAAQVPDAQAQEKVTAQSSPAPAVQTPEKAPEQSLAAAAETREKTPEQSPAQQTVSAQLRAVLDAPADPSCFQYMPEPGTATNGLSWYGAEHPKPERALQKLVGKGLRITAYTGFDAERVVIPAKIGGLPVVSIGEKVFKNTTVSEVILPESIKAILREAFSGCKRLQHIDLPDGLEYLGSHCFAGSGLTALHFPDRLKTIPEGCCGGCANLSDVTFGQQVQTIQGSAFHACKKLQTVSFPESLLRVDNDAFETTAITRFIFPAGVQEVGDVKHSRFYIEPRYPEFDRTISDSPVLVFLGMDAVLKIIDPTNIALIYCLPGSKVQQIARDKGIPVRPLSEFQMEDA